MAAAVLAVPVGGRVPTTLALARTADTASGTVQSALRRLEESGAVGTSAHGASGRRVQRKDVAALWRATGRGPLTGVLPLPDSREFSGLATALTELAERGSVPIQLLFRQGSRTRAEALRSGRVDLVVMSQTAARALDIPVDSLVLGSNTYYRSDSVVVITRVGATVGQPAQVPVDRSSGDHLRLSRAEFPDAELVDTPYPFVPDAVLRGTFPAAVWHCTASSPLLVGSGLRMHPLVHPSAAGEEQIDRAALVWRAEDPVVGAVIAAVFTPSELGAIQHDVLQGTRTPRF